MTEWEELEKAALSNVANIDEGESVDKFWGNPYFEVRTLSYVSEHTTVNVWIFACLCILANSLIKYINGIFSLISAQYMCCVH